MVLPSSQTVHGDDQADVLSVIFEGLCRNSARNYGYVLDDFARHLKAGSGGAAIRELIGMPHDEANRIVSEYLADLKSRSHAPETIVHRASILRRAVRRARLAGLTALSLDVETPRSISIVPERCITAKEWKCLSEAAESEAKVNERRTRDLPLILLLHDRALRPVEVAKIDLADVDLEAPSVRVGGIWLAINPDTRNALARWIATRGEWPGPLFIREHNGVKGRLRLSARSVSRVVQALWSRAGMSGQVHGLDLRKAAIARAIELGWSALELREFMRTVRTDQILSRRQKEAVDIGATFPRRTERRGPKGGGRRSCPVRMGRSDSRVCWVLGRRKPRLNRTQYRVIKALIEAIPDGLTGPELFLKSNSSDYRNVLRRMTGQDADWQAVIHFPETTRGERYRISRD